jgi:hypothetical protein
LLTVLAVALLVMPTPSEGLPALPSGWPTTLHLGLADAPGGAAQLKASTGVGIRYQYLSGGVNTGNGWATWLPDGSFVTEYIQETVQQGMIPVFSYYMLVHSAPGNAQAEQVGIITNLQTQATMRAFYQDLTLFFQRAGATGSRVVLHVEPDMWGYMHSQRAVGDDATSVPVQVAATGLSDLAGLPDNGAGLAQAIARLRDRYAPNVLLGYQLSVWGTKSELHVSDPPNATVDALAARAAAFFTSLGGRFDLVFAEFSDRDAAYYQYVVGDGGEAWWDAGDFPRFARYLAGFVAIAGKRVVLWQIPLGNTRMRAMNNTWGHYQDNRVEWFLDDPTRAHLAEYVQAGVIAFLFGDTVDGTTCACDASGDGVTNPAPINGNTRVSLNADDDGGFFRERAAAYYAAGALSLDGGTAPPPPPPPPGSGPTFTLTVTRAGTGSGSVTSAPAGISCGTDCSEAYASGTGVILTAAAAAGSVFTGWSGGCSGTGACTATMTANRAVTATFTAQTTGPPSFTVTGTTTSPNPVAPGASTTIKTSVTNTGGAASSILVDLEVFNAGGTRVHQQYTTGLSFQAGEQKTVQWVWPVAAGQAVGTYTVKLGVFSGNWSTLYTWQNGAASVSVQAGGGSQSFTLAVTRAGTGSGSVTSAPAGISCGTDCSEAYASGTGVTLTATAAAGSVFAGWSGGGCSGTGACTGTMTANRSVTATFTAQTGGPPGFTVTGTTASPNPVARGASTTIKTSVTNTGGPASSILVDLEVFDAGGTRVHQQYTTGLSFQAGEQKTVQWVWPVAATQTGGTYTVKLGVFSGDWGTLYTWNNGATFLTVTSPP